MQKRELSIKNDEYNKTQLNPENEFGRGVFNRDRFAHYLRWSHILSKVRKGTRILDVGCGSSNLLLVLYSNRCIPKLYLGVDVRKRTIDISNEKWAGIKWAKFSCLDVVKTLPYGSLKWDMIVCLEVLEHVGKRNASKILKNIHTCMSKDTTLFLSTPVFDPKVGAADNHMISGQVGEFGFNELKKLLNKYFEIKNVWGTFASQKDYKYLMTNGQREVFDKLKRYYDACFLSVIMAPMFPEQSRNCIWECSKK